MSFTNTSTLKIITVVTLAFLILLPTTIVTSVYEDSTQETYSFGFVTPSETSKLIMTSSKINIIDLRDESLYYNKHILNAVSLPYQANSCWECVFDSIEFDEDILLYSESRDNLKVTANQLYGFGFTNIYLFDYDIDKLELYDIPINKGITVAQDSLYYTGCISLDNFEVDEPQQLTLNQAPAEWDWRMATIQDTYGDWTSPAKSQGPCGSCWGFAAMGALEAVINIQSGNPDYDIDLSEQYLLSCPSSSGGCSGWNAYQAYWYLSNNGGAIPESCFYYQADDTVACTDKCDNWMTKLFPLTGFGAKTNADRETIKSMLLTYGPLVTEMAVYGDFGSYESGIYEHPGEEPTSAINHQVVIVGYNDEQEYWICKNSWGYWWGENGFFNIAYGDCQIEHSVIYVEVSPALARIGGPYYGGVGETISFDGTASESLVSAIATYEWNLGDGTIKTGSTPTHTYSDEGRYMVTLTVTDLYGNTGTAKARVYIDSEQPEITIISPEKNKLYFYDEKLGYMPFRTVVIGRVTMTFSAFDESSGVETIAVYIDDDLFMSTDGTSVDTMVRDAPFGLHKIIVEATDRAGNIARETIKVFFWMTGD